jgi:hypothetical protein
MGRSKYDSASLSFGKYISQLRARFEDVIASSLLHKKWRGKDKPIRDNRDLLANLETRIEINERKKEGLEQAIKLAGKEQDYLNELVFSIKDKKPHFQLEE